MIRWTEQADSLRLEYSHTFEAALSGGLGAATGSVAMLATITGGGLAIESKIPYVWLVPLLPAIAFAVASVLCLGACRLYARWGGWAEVGVRGGWARWGGGGGPVVTDWMAVRRFEIVTDETGRPSIDAVLPDGRRVLVLGPWFVGLRRKVDRLAGEMNANLCSPDDPLAAK